MSRNSLLQSWPALVLRKWIWLIGLLPAALDLVALYVPMEWIPSPIQHFIQDLPSAAVTLVLFSAGLLLSSYLVHRDLEARLGWLQSVQANLTLIAAEAVLVHEEPVSTLEGTSFDGLKPNGLPVMATAQAALEIHNLGSEDGELDWHLVHQSSKFPPGFATFMPDDNGHVHDLPDSFPARAKTRSTWNLRLYPSVNDPYEFAEALRTRDTFSILIRYRTLRVGNPSEFRTLDLTGSLQAYRALLFERWRSRGLLELSGTATGPDA